MRMCAVMKRRTKVWATLRSNHLRTYPECRACDSDRDVVVHHLRYRGPAGESEHSGDLVTLCTACHDNLHRELGRSPKFEHQLAVINGRRLYRDLALMTAMAENETRP